MRVRKISHYCRASLISGYRTVGIGIGCSLPGGDRSWEWDTVDRDLTATHDTFGGQGMYSVNWLVFGGRWVYHLTSYEVNALRRERLGL